MSLHLARLGVRPAGEYQARRAVCGTLARSGVRASELCDLRIGHVRLHDPGGARFRIPVAEIVRDAAEEASERLSARGLPPLPHTTPHTLRRTYISIALLANRFDVLWVMGQVGHADSKMTMDVYAQLQQRVKREHGRAFDTLVRQAREQLYGTTSGLPEAAPEPNLGHESGHEATLGGSDGPGDGRIGEQEPSDVQADRGMARPGLEPGTPRFSVVCSTN